MSLTVPDSITCTPSKTVTRSIADSLSTSERQNPRQQNTNTSAQTRADVQSTSQDSNSAIGSPMTVAVVKQHVSCASTVTSHMADTTVTLMGRTARAPPPTAAATKN